MPIKDLNQLIQGLQKYKKSECTEMIRILRCVLHRKKELLNHEDIDKTFYSFVFWQWIRYNKDKEQAYRILKVYN